LENLGALRQCRSQCGWIPRPTLHAQGLLVARLSRTRRFASLVGLCRIITLPTYLQSSGKALRVFAVHEHEADLAVPNHAAAAAQDPAALACQPRAAGGNAAQPIDQGVDAAVGHQANGHRVQRPPQASAVKAGKFKLPEAKHVL
jgi:hypothetical protein